MFKDRWPCYVLCRHANIMYESRYAHMLCFRYVFTPDCESELRIAARTKKNTQIHTNTRNVRYKDKLHLHRAAEARGVVQGVGGARPERQRK